jgi:hypothetical protein
VPIASRKLRHYFQAHKVSLVTPYPLRTVLHNPNAIRNFAKWAAELVEFNLEFAPCHAIKSHALTDFVAELTMSAAPPKDSEHH